MLVAMLKQVIPMIDQPDLYYSSGSGKNLVKRNKWYDTAKMQSSLNISSLLRKASLNG